MSQVTKLDSKDRWVAVVLTLLGGAGLMVALLRNWNAQEMNPGIEGSLTVGVLAPILALSSGIGYRHTVTVSLPILLIQYATCFVAAGPALAVVSLELCCLGFLGFVIAFFEPQPGSPSRPRPRQERRSAMHGAAPALPS
jgi:hypothetical protein